MWGLMGGVLPFEFSWNTTTRPAGESVGLEEAKVANGGVEEVLHREESQEGEDLLLFPVKRCLPALGTASGPALGEPELGAGIAVVLNEGEVVADRDKAVGELERLQVDLVLRRLVVEGEGEWVGGIGGDTDVDEASLERLESHLKR